MAGSLSAIELPGSLGELQAQVVDVVSERAEQFDVWFTGLFGPAHPLSASKPLVQPHWLLALCLAYLSFVLIVPLIFRALRFSVKLKPVMRLYNLFMVALSAYMGAKSILLARESNDSLWCVPLAKGRAGDEMALLVWVFTFSKVIEFLDTVFMILEGRMRQVSFLHVYHHLSIFPYWFAILWLSPGSDAYFSLAGNSFIHVLMYSYYLLASFGYSPWWKYYITKAQIFQFICFCGQSSYVGYIKKENECDFPQILAKGLLWYMLTLIALFMHFLVKNAGKKKNPSTAPAKKVV